MNNNIKYKELLKQYMFLLSANNKLSVENEKLKKESFRLNNILKEVRKKLNKGGFNNEI